MSQCKWDEILNKLEYLVTCSDLEMKDGDTAREIVQQVLPCLKSFKREIQRLERKNLRLWMERRSIPSKLDGI